MLAARPDDPPEKPMELSPENRNIAHIAAARALGRLRWYAQNDQSLEAVFRDHDTVMAEALGVPLGEVPALTSTREEPDPEMAEFQRLLSESSLGTIDPAEAADAQNAMALALLRRAMEGILFAEQEEAVRVLAEVPEVMVKPMRAVMVQLMRVVGAADLLRDEGPALPEPDGS